MQKLMDSSTTCALSPLPVDQVSQQTQLTAIFGQLDRNLLCVRGFQRVVRGHLFSRHDNRHALQNDGVYFGRVSTPSDENSC